MTLLANKTGRVFILREERPHKFPTNKIIIGRNGICLNGKQLSPTSVGSFFDRSISFKLRPRFCANFFQTAKVIGLILEDHFNEGGDPKIYAEQALPIFLAKADSLANLERWHLATEGMWLDYKNNFLRPVVGFAEKLSQILSIFKSIEELKQSKFLVTQSFFASGFIVAGKEASSLMLDLIDEVKSLQDLYEVERIFGGVREAYDEPDSYMGFFVLNLLRKAKSVLELRMIRTMIIDFIKRCGDPGFYVCKVLPVMMEQIEVANWPAWDKAGKDFVIDKCRKNGAEPHIFITVLAHAYKECNSLDELKSFEVTPEIQGDIIMQLLGSLTMVLNI